MNSTRADEVRLIAMPVDKMMALRTELPQDVWRDAIGAAWDAGITAEEAKAVVNARGDELTCGEWAATKKLRAAFTEEG